MGERLSGMAAGKARAWLLLALAWLVVACGAELQPRIPEQELLPMATQPPAPSGTPREGAALLAAATGGPLRVIVTLDVGYRPEPELGSPAAVLEQRRSIDGLGSALTARLGLQAEEVRRYRRFPYLAMAVDQARLRALLADPAVARVVEELPDRPQLSESIPIIGADGAWGLGFDGSGMAVAVLDTGVDAAHPFLGDGAGGSVVVAEACFSSTGVGSGYASFSACPAGSNPSGLDSQVGPGAAAPCDDAADHADRGTDDCHHGSHVAGAVAGRDGPDGLGGVAPGAGIVAVQVFSYFPSAQNADCPQNCALTWPADQIAGLEWLLDLIEGAEPQYPDFDLELVAANMSLGGQRHLTPCFGDARRPAIRALRAAGVATIVSVGNNGYVDAVGAPACVPEAIAVGSTDDGSGGSVADAWSPFSNANFMVDLAAPGRWISSSIPGGGYATYAGTSMAAPQVAGALALLRHAHPGVGVEEMLDMLQATGTPVEDSGGVQQRRIDVELALAAGPRDRLWLQPLADRTPGTVESSRYAEAGHDAYAAADFDVPVAQQVELIAVSGFHDPVLASSWPGNLSHFDWYLYPDAGGRPAGHPDDGQDAHRWHLRLQSDHPAVVRRGLELQLDLPAAGQTLDLEAGRYWLVFHATTELDWAAAGDLDRWRWFGAPPALAVDRLSQQAGAWSPIAPSGDGWTDRAFRLLGGRGGEPAVVAVGVSLSSSVLAAGGSARAFANVVTAGGASAAVAWSSSDPTVAGVAADGRVSALAPGTTQITATSVFDPSRSGSATLTVPSPPSDSATLVFGANTAADADLLPGSQDAPVLATTASVPGGSRTVRLQGAQLRVRVPGIAVGSPVDSRGLRRVEVHHDLNRNGLVDAGDVLLGSSELFALNGSVSMTFSTTLDLFAGGSAALLLSYDLWATEATRGWPWWSVLLLPPSLLLLRSGRRRLLLILASLALLVAACGGGEELPADRYHYGLELVQVAAVSEPMGVVLAVEGLPLEGARLSFPRP